MFLPRYRPVFGHAVLIALLASARLAATVAMEPGKQEIRHGKNVALGATYELSPAPNYPLCTDLGDLTQLTDGKTTSDYFWTQRGTVGWTGVSYATVTVDLGVEQPISGVSFHTAAGVAGVAWPAAISVLVSDDGRNYRNVGDLVALDHKVNGPWPEGYAIRWLTTTELRTKGRFVCFVVLPLSRGSFIFVDEVEVFRGPDKLLNHDSGGEPVGSAAQFVKQVVQDRAIERAVHHRLESDRDAIRRAIQVATLADKSLRGSIEPTRRGLLRGRRVGKADGRRSLIPRGVAAQSRPCQDVPSPSRPEKGVRPAGLRGLRGGNVGPNRSVRAAIALQCHPPGRHHARRISGRGLESRQ